MENQPVYGGQPNWIIRIILTAVLSVLIGATAASLFWASDELAIQRHYRTQITLMVHTEQLVQQQRNEARRQLALLQSQQARASAAPAPAAAPGPAAPDPVDAAFTQLAESVLGSIPQVSFLRTVVKLLSVVH